MKIHLHRKVRTIRCLTVTTICMHLMYNIRMGYTTCITALQTGQTRKELQHQHHQQDLLVKAAYKYIDFGEGVKQVNFMVAPGADSASIMVGLDNPWIWFGPTVKIPGGGDSKSWTTMSVPFGPVKGVHAVWLVFHTKGSGNFKVDWFRFE